MPGADVIIRLAEDGDLAAVAQLHAENWQRHYRGAYSDRYLDGDLVADRMSVWAERLARPDGERFTLVAESDGAKVGFAHAVLDADARHGALLDNLHVVGRDQRRGLGTRLLAATAGVVLARRPASSLYLWVLEPNRAAQAFYRARGGVFGEPVLVDPPKGDPANLNGAVRKIRVSWADPAVLIDLDIEGVKAPGR